MFWSSKALPWLVPSLLLTAPPASNVIVVSPWIEDVSLQVSRWEGRHTLEGEVKLTEVMTWLSAERRLNFIFYSRADQLRPSLNPRVAAIEKSAYGIAQFRGVDNLHAKMIVTDSTVLETSANLLTRSLYTNVEALMVRDNPDRNAMRYAQAFFIRHGTDVR